MPSLVGLLLNAGRRRGHGDVAVAAWAGSEPRSWSSLPPAPSSARSVSSAVRRSVGLLLTVLLPFEAGVLRLYVGDGRRSGLGAPGHRGRGIVPQPRRTWVFAPIALPKFSDGIVWLVVRVRRSRQRPSGRALLGAALGVRWARWRRSRSVGTPPLWDSEGTAAATSRRSSAGSASNKEARHTLAQGSRIVGCAVRDRPRLGHRHASQVAFDGSTTLLTATRILLQLIPRGARRSSAPSVGATVWSARSCSS